MKKKARGAGLFFVRGCGARCLGEGKAQIGDADGNMARLAKAGVRCDRWLG